MNVQTDENKIYKAIDLFAGIGGTRIAFEEAFENRIDFVYANEIDKYACKTYEANFNEDPDGDITKESMANIPDFDILVAGFPCQAFSLAGHKRGFDDTRGTLFFYIAKILREKKPEAFLLENVKHLKHHDKGRTFRIIKDVLTKDLGYQVYYKILNAKDFGLPQNRERIYVVGFRERLAFDFPEPTNKEAVLDDILQKDVPDKYYLSQEYLNGLKKHRARHEAKGHGFGYEVVSRNGIANTIVLGGMGKERNLVKDKILENCWKKEGDDISLRNNEGIRKMTPREWARLQGFPESYKFPVAMTRKYKLIANSVPIPVVKEIAKKMKEALDKKDIIKLNADEEKTLTVIDLMVSLYEDNQITETGRKYVSTIERYIERKCIRVDNFKELLNFMQKNGLLKIDGSMVQMNKKILDTENRSVFRKTVRQLLNGKHRTNQNRKLDSYFVKLPPNKKKNK